ncbi:hypothetical protein LSH36_128g01011 [Paralvinella palmiformis]|uniref:Annelid erythrocruorin linker subunit C-terminal domain-containing protein n=1 Tax=Paralvinella palmiformis TaxID=53620 RepID=A0AAD9JWL2_9ANNE|nr:hypothetical protein LSH36_128g01011 [Paralvinella palmiformis]
MKMLVFVLSLVASTLAGTNYCFELVGKDIDKLAADVLNFEDSVNEAVENHKERYNKGLDMAHRIHVLKGCGQASSGVIRVLQFPYLDTPCLLLIYSVRLGSSPGSSCDDEHEFQCGGHDPRCLSRLLVCDGEEDCSNGADERQCEIIAPVGSKWKGEMTYDHCTDSKPKNFLLTILGHKTSKAFLSVPEIKAELYVEDALTDLSYALNLPLDGYVDMRPAAQSIAFRHPLRQGQMLTCTFDGIRRDHCHGEIKYAASGIVCAEFYMERIGEWRAVRGWFTVWLFGS